jgi:hypothetical protein
MVIVLNFIRTNHTVALPSKVNAASDAADLAVSHRCRLLQLLTLFT